MNISEPSCVLYQKRKTTKAGESFSWTPRFRMRISSTPVSVTLLFKERGTPLKPEGLVAVAKIELHLDSLLLASYTAMDVCTETKEALHIKIHTERSCDAAVDMLETVTELAWCYDNESARFIEIGDESIAEGHRAT